MTSLLQLVRNYWPPAVRTANRDLEIGTAMSDQNSEDKGAEAKSASEQPAAERHPAERVRRYRTLIELRQLLHSFAEPARTTVVLVLDSQMSVHLPTLLARSTFAFRLIVTSSEGYLLGTMSPVDLALQARSWGWSSVAYERDLPQALAAARESTAADEQLLVLMPNWLDLQS
jgi:hypothetical protein